jgi:hypothetical protein
MPLTEVVAPVTIIVPPPLLPVIPENIKELPSAETTTDCNGEPKPEGVSPSSVNPVKEPDKTVSEVLVKVIPEKARTPPDITGT